MQAIATGHTIHLVFHGTGIGIDKYTGHAPNLPHMLASRKPLLLSNPTCYNASHV
ncbi:hypothetical protein AA0472_1258 [Acetobacter estunensis NRIC 0472]|nr:hypothetical protein AA0472_1258 [Acetobacter estunensis NRIC 0472]